MNVVFVSVADVEYAHARALAKDGGQGGVRDRGLLESAVMAARSGYYTSLAEIAAVYAHGIAKNHPFLDGNKRTALIVAVAFLRVHGHALKLGAEWVGHIERLASGELTRDDLTKLFAAEMLAAPTWP